MQVQKARTGYKIVQLSRKYEEIPEDWNVEEIQNHAKITTGDKNTQDRIENGKYPFFVRSQKIERINSYSFDGEAVLTAGDGDIGKIFHYINGKFDFHQRVYKISNFDNMLDGRFFYLYFSKYFLDRALSMSAKNTVDSIRMEMISKMQILLPPKSEQQKISSILSNVDSLITQTQKIIEQTQKLKKGLMQKLLTRGIGHSKFKKVNWYFGKEIMIPEDWEVTAIGKEFNLSAGGTPKTNITEFFKGQIPWITSSDLDRGFIHTYTALITEDAIKKTNLKVYPKGSFIIAAIGVDAAQTRGNCGILKFDATINQVCVGFEKSKRVATKFFFYYYLQYANNLIFTFSQGTKQWAFYPYVIRKIRFFLPPYDEQQKIASILSNVDSQITKQQEYKSKLESLKKGLMQKLLTGQIRVRV